VEFRPRRLVAELAGEGVHQGVLAIAGQFRYVTVNDILKAAAQAGEPPLLVLLDGITDPHNLGAIVRSAEVLGAHGVVIPAHRAAPVTAGAVKASAGATERVRIAEVVNLLKAVAGLREAGVRVLGAGAGSGERLDRVDLRGPIALVVGAEGKGMREAVARRCDGLFHIPQRGVVSSLNASVAAAIALYEAARQRSDRDPAEP
jgi:23S rRNA (guanosine2251-2'-O)-methyltransferase